MSGPLEEGTPNGVDRLAQIEADARKTLAEDAPSSLVLWKPWAMDRADDVLALVEIAKAARLIQAFDQAGGNDWWEAHAKLYAALARLDSGAAEGDA